MQNFNYIIRVDKDNIIQETDKAVLISTDEMQVWLSKTYIFFNPSKDWVTIYLQGNWKFKINVYETDDVYETDVYELVKYFNDVEVVTNGK